MDNKTLLQMRTDARERADMVNSQFITDATFNGWINDNIKELWDLLTEAVQDYALSSSSFTISSGNTQALPADFYKLRGLDDMSDTNRPKTVRNFNFNERNDYQNNRIANPYTSYSDVSYRITGSTLTILPADNAARAYKLWYIPIPTTLSADGDNFDGINGWHEYVILKTTIQALAKQESDTKAWETLLKLQIDRIEKLKGNRDQSSPEKVSRVRNRSRETRDYLSSDVE